MISWKQIAVLLQALVFALAPLGVANASHSGASELDSHYHFAPVNHAQPHHGLSARKISSGQTMIADSGSDGDEGDHGFRICCHVGGGTCAPVAVIPASGLLAMTEPQSLLDSTDFDEFVYNSQSGIFHPPRL